MSTPRWFLAPLYSRGTYSPRLTAAWVILFFALWLTRRWITWQPTVVNGILIQAPQVAEVLGILIGAVLALFGLGTLQKIRLDGPPPAPDMQITADSAPVSATNATINQSADEKPES